MTPCCEIPAVKEPIRDICALQTRSRSSPLISSQFYRLLHPFRVYFIVFPTRFECIVSSSPPVSSVFHRLLHPFRVYFIVFSTRFECNFRDLFATAQESFAYIYDMKGGAEVKLHSKRVEKIKIQNYARNEWGRLHSTLKTSGEDRSTV